MKFGINNMSAVLKMGQIHEAKSSEISHFQYNKSSTVAIYPKFSLLHTHACYSKLIPYLLILLMLPCTHVQFVSSYIFTKCATKFTVIQILANKITIKTSSLVRTSETLD